MSIVPHANVESISRFIVRVLQHLHNLEEPILGWAGLLNPPSKIQRQMPPAHRFRIDSGAPQSLQPLLDRPLTYMRSVTQPVELIDEAV
ncbi:MAG: hypothetical protein M0Z85_03260 [Gammaproteobacteria bacterium]|nr:hypothetical protein [Gammaproteobacteria bacterium]